VRAAGFVDPTGQAPRWLVMISPLSSHIPFVIASCSCLDLGAGTLLCVLQLLGIGCFSGLAAANLAMRSIWFMAIFLPRQISDSFSTQCSFDVVHCFPRALT